MAGAGERFGLLCRFRKGGEEGGSICETPSENAAPARVSRMASAQNALKGPLASGGVGDILIENDEVVFVIDEIAKTEVPSEGGGYLIDAADARFREDELGAFVPYHGQNERRAIYEKMQSGVNDQGMAFVDVYGHDRAQPEIKIHTRYSLGPLDRTLLVSTEIQNSSEKAIGPVDLGDRVHWGSTALLIPGERPEADSKDRRSIYMGGLGRDISYLIAPVGDSDIFSSTAEGQSELIFERNILISPGAAHRYERVISVAQRGDPVALANEFFFLQGGAPGGLSIQLLDSNKKNIPVTPNSRIVLERVPAVEGAAPSWVDTWWMKSTLKDAANPQSYVLGGEIPPGRYAIQYEGDGRRSSAKAIAEVKSGALSHIVLLISEPQNADSIPRAP